MNRKIIIFFILLVILSINVSAIRIRLGEDNKIFFQPKMQKELIITVSDAERVATVPIALKGDMAKYATVDQKTLTMNPGDQKDIKVTLSLPEDIPKGVNILEISATEVPVNASKGSFIWMPAVGMSIKIINTDVQYDCSPGMFNAQMGGKSVSVTISASNNGLSAVEDAYVDLAIYSEEGMPLAKWKTTLFKVPPFDSGSVQTNKDFSETPPGYYTLKGTLFCGGKTFNLERQMLSAATALNINEFRVYKKDGNLHVEFDLSNDFKAPVEATSAVEIFDGEKKLDSYSLPGVGVPPLGSQMLGMGVPMSGLYVSPGTFNLKATIGIGGQRQVFEKEITFTEEELSTESSGGGFTVNQPAQKAEEPQQIVLEQPSSEGTSNKTLIRIIAGVLILVILTLIILKVLSKKSH